MTVDTIIEHVHRLLLDHLPVRTNRTPSGWQTFDCVMCNDKRKRAGVIVTGAKISYNCFNCKYSTGWSPGPHLGKKYRELAERMGASDKEVHTVQLELMKSGTELMDMDESSIDYAFSKFKPIELPDTAQRIEDLPDDHELKKYAKERGILGRYPLWHFTDIPNKRRVIVPFIFNGELVGYSGRHVNPSDKSTPKYLMNTQPGFVFNVDSFANDDREIVIVVEGIFDAILIDGVSVLGNSITPEQALLIEKLNKRIIVCPDRDEAGKELIEQALALGWEVSFPPWEKNCKDAADAVARYGTLATIQSIIKYATGNPTKIKVQTKLL